MPSSIRSIPAPVVISAEPHDYKIWKIITAAAVGTMIEWYDFYIFGSLATVISPLFYPKGNNTLALIAYLSTFAVGFVVRPFGALFFGRIGDLVGRKYAFLVTLLIMGGATSLIGFLPTYATIGIAAPIILLAIRIFQGLALGGEYGGAAVYVAEHVPDAKRGFYTSFIQITATLGLFISLAVILIVQNLMTKDSFSAWGWRIPFLISIFLVGISLYIRLRMKESPIFQHIKSTGMTSAKPLKEAFTKWENLKRVLISLFGATAGQGVVWYTGQFYALFYLQTVLNVHGTSASYIIAIALLLGMPFFVVFGALSDRLGRKRIIMLGCLLAAVSYIPIYRAMQSAAGSNVVTASPIRNAVTGSINLTPQTYVDGALQPAKQVLTYIDFASLISNPIAWKLILLVFIQVIFVTMVYGPIAAYLVEAFPARIRYTSLSLPYHIGNGVFGGLLPLIGLYVVARTGNIYAGLYYPIIVAGATFIVGSLLLKETRHVLIWHETETGSEPLGENVSEETYVRAKDDDVIEWQFVQDYGEFALQMNFQAITALLEKARSVSDPIRRKSICLSGLQLLYSSYEDFSILLHAFKNRKDGKHLHLTIGVEDQTKTGTTSVPRLFKHYESARQMLDNFGFTSITHKRMTEYLDISEKEFEAHYQDIASSVRGLGDYQDSINIHKNRLKHGKPVLEGIVDRKDMAENVLFLRWSENSEKWTLELRWVKASLEQLEVATKQVAKLYIRSLEFLWLFMLHYYPQHAKKFRDEAMVKCSKECIEQVRGLGLESEGLT